MAQYGLLPDLHISSAVARALSFQTNVSDPTEVDSRGRIAPPLPSVSPKDVFEAASSKNLSRLRRSATCESPVIGEIDNRRHSTGNVNAYHSGQQDEYISAKMVGGAIRASEGFLSSNRFSTQLRMADRTLDFLYPDLVIDLGNPNGTSCPRFSCRKSFGILDLIRHFPIDSNRYTVKCPHCQMEYVPRFTVNSSLSTWEGSEGLSTPLWCELLSPWVLQKEIINVIQSNGIEVIVSPSFRDSRTNPQYSVLFWNLMVYYRLYGLPYAFLITEKMSLAFLIPLDD